MGDKYALLCSSSLFSVPAHSLPHPYSLLSPLFSAPLPLLCSPFIISAPSLSFALFSLFPFLTLFSSHSASLLSCPSPCSLAPPYSLPLPCSLLPLPTLCPFPALCCPSLHSAFPSLLSAPPSLRSFPAHISPFSRIPNQSNQIRTRYTSFFNSL